MKKNYSSSGSNENKMPSGLPRYWDIFYRVENIVQCQADPYYYNRYETIINAAIKDLEQERIQAQVSGATDLLFMFKSLRVKYLLNHPWRSMMQEQIDEAMASADNAVVSVLYRKIGWLHSEEKLFQFHNKLYKAGKIVCDCDNFSARFIGNNSSTLKIRWYGGLLELVHLISKLLDERFIPFRRDYIVMVCENFEKGNGEPLNDASLRTLKSRHTSEFIDDFINNLVAELGSYLTPTP